MDNFLVFTNGLYNFSTHEFCFVPTLPVSSMMTTGYQYQESSATAIRKIKKVLNDIFPNEECRDHLLLCHVKLLQGNDTTLHISLPSDSVGAKIVHKLFTNVLGHYASQGHPSLITQSSNWHEARKAIRSKRYIYIPCLTFPEAQQNDNFMFKTIPCESMSEAAVTEIDYLNMKVSDDLRNAYLHLLLNVRATW